MSAMDADDFVVTSSTGNTDAGAASPSVPVAVSGDASPDSVPTPEQASADADLTNPVTSEPTEPERTPDGKFAPKKDSIQARIDKATREKYDAIRERDAIAARVAELERAQRPPAQFDPTAAVAASPDRPKIDDFQSYEEWVEAVADWKADQRLARFQHEQYQQQAERQRLDARRTFADREQAYAAATPDYADVMARAANTPISPLMEEAILASDRGPQLAYFLATHPEEATSLAQETANLPASAASLVRRLLDSKLTTSPTASSGPVVGGVHRSVPAPIKPVGAAPVVTDTPLDSLDVDAFVARENARERAERKGRLGMR